MSYNRILRGPMAADSSFTQISNSLFRDPRLSGRDKGIFGFISTHRDGYGVTPESIAACMTDGVSSVKTSLRSLERYGYLKRHRVRREDGTLGGSVYYITDQPDGLPEPKPVEHRRSEPTVKKPPLVEPTVVNRLHKNTIPLEHQREEDSLPAEPAEKPPPTPRTAPERDERQPSSTHTPPPRTQAHKRVHALQLVAPEHENTFIEWVTRNFHVRSSGWWRAAEDADLIAHARTWQQQEAVRVQPVRRVREWCGECARDVPGLGSMGAQARTNPAFRRLPSGELCPRCHPSVVGLHAAVA